MSLQRCVGTWVFSSSKRSEKQTCTQGSKPVQDLQVHEHTRAHTSIWHLIPHHITSHNITSSNTISTSIAIYIYIYIYIYLSISIYLYIYISISLSLYRCIYLYIYLSIHICLYQSYVRPAHIQRIWNSAVWLKRDPICSVCPLLNQRESQNCLTRDAWLCGLLACRLAESTHPYGFMPPHNVHMAHFQLGSFLIGLVSNWAQF